MSRLVDEDRAGGPTAGRDRDRCATDPTAARVHWRKAEEHHEAAERFRKLGLTQAEAEARDAADTEEHLAMRLEGRGV